MLKRIIAIMLSPILACSIGAVALAAITVSVSPTADTVLPGSVRTVYSNTQGATNTAVSWIADGGTIQTSTGYYIKWKAPTSPGNYKIQATSIEDGSTYAIALFTVISTATVGVSNIPMQATAFKNQPIVIQSILWGSTNTAVTWDTSGGMLTGNGREVVFSADVAGTYTVTSTSLADSSKSATTTIVVTDKISPATSTAKKTQPIDCTATGSGSTYEVTTEGEMDNVPWSNLSSGDTVRIHPGTYHKQILISTAGTESQPIRICGIADENGNLPELNGSNATAQIGTDYSSGYSMQPYAGILIHDRHASYYGGEVYPQNIIIEGLKVAGYNTNNKFIDTFTGLPTAYVNGAAPIRVQHGKNITIRGNDLTDCGNGLFTMSNNGIEAQTTRNLLIEGNYIHSNGVDSSYREHQSYVQAFGLVVQGNYYDQPRSGMMGGQLKTRSVQQFIRYNYFEPSARILDLVEIQDHGPFVFPWIGIDPKENINTSSNEVVANHEAYQNQYVYGNIIKNIGTNAAAWIIHAAADNDQTYNYGGNYYFYNNTIWTSLISGESSSYRSGLVDSGPYGTTIGAHNVWPTVRMSNNAIFIAQSSPSSDNLFFWNRLSADRVILDKNWISTRWGSGDTAGGDGTGISNVLYAGQWQGGTVATQVSGLSNLVTGATAPFDATTFLPLSEGPLNGTSASLPDEIASLPPLMKYNISTYSMSRRTSAQDLGAVDSSTSVPVSAATPVIKKITIQ